ncbi:MAG TPA: DUF192 domain-containing protein [Acidimicrobiales bacterium]|nr:DUF192 domain-containing protein [Acidimicrobiales bacterium]
MSWLLRDGDVLAAAEVAGGLAGRARGLLGRDGYDGAMILPRTRSVHTIGMRFPIDVAFCDQDLVVLDTARLVPHRLSRPRRRCRWVVEAEAGAFDRWGLRVGDRLELR